MTIEDHGVERRQNPRCKVCWPVIIEAGDRCLHTETADVSTFGVKLRLDERLEVGSRTRLRLRPAERDPIEVEALVWRVGPDGPAFFFFDGCPNLLPVLEGLQASTPPPGGHHLVGGAHRWDTSPADAPGRPGARCRRAHRAGRPHRRRG